MGFIGEEVYLEDLFIQLVAIGTDFIVFLRVPSDVFHARLLHRGHGSGIGNDIAVLLRHLVPQPDGLFHLKLFVSDAVCGYHSLFAPFAFARRFVVVGISRDGIRVGKQAGEIHIHKVIKVIVFDSLAAAECVHLAEAEPEKFGERRLIVGLQSRVQQVGLFQNVQFVKPGDYQPLNRFAQSLGCQPVQPPYCFVCQLVRLRFSHGSTPPVDWIQFPRVFVPDRL